MTEQPMKLYFPFGVFFMTIGMTDYVNVQDILSTHWTEVIQLENNSTLGDNAL